MKITFTKLPTTDGTIKVSLDGGQSFTEYNIADIHESGISLSDDQDFEKIRIKGPANVLKNLNIVSGVKVEVDSGVDLSDYVRKEYIHCELCEGPCSNHYMIRITELPDNLDDSFISIFYFSDGTSLRSLCSQSYNMLEKPTGQLYVKASNYGSCPGNYVMIPTQYYLV